MKVFISCVYEETLKNQLKVIKVSEKQNPISCLMVFVCFVFLSESPISVVFVRQLMLGIPETLSSILSVAAHVMDPTLAGRDPDRVAPLERFTCEWVLWM